MSPVNLADLPSDQPAPTGLVQMRRGAADGVGNFVAADPRQWIADGAGVIAIALTPPRDGWWWLRAETIWSTNYGAWTHVVWSIQVNADQTGAASNWITLHSAVGWQESVIDMVYPLSAGVAYTAGLVWESFTGAGTHSIWRGPGYTYISGEFVGEGAV